MSTYSQSRNRILLITLAASILIHATILKIITANSFSTGKTFSLTGGKGKIKVTLKSLRSKKNTEKPAKIIRQSTAKNVTKIRKRKKSKRKKGTVSLKKNPLTTEAIPVYNKIETKQTPDRQQPSENNNSSKISEKIENRTEKTGERTGGNLFSFLDWRKHYIRVVINQLEKEKEYPMAAREMGIQGTVKLLLTVSKTGNLESVKILESSGFKILDQNAVETAKKAKFPPFPDEVKKERIDIPVYVIYRLNDLQHN
ncbi:energy transducer TonB [Desulfurobacterium sp.]